MKTIVTMIFAGALLFSSCGSDAVEAKDAEKEAEGKKENTVYVIDTKESTVEWTGTKLNSGHTGLIDIKSGELKADGKLITAGAFMIDMKSIHETGNEDTESAEMLAGHLMAADFFDAEVHPTCSFAITQVTEKDGDYIISGNLTIKGIEKNISFPAKVEADGKVLMADAEFTINRNDWGVSYGSGITGAVADKAIGDDISFVVHLKADVAK